MSPSIVMLLAMGVMYACGIYLMLDRSLTRVLLGFMLMGNATNVLIMLTAGPPGRPPQVRVDRCGRRAPRRCRPAPPPGAAHPRAQVASTGSGRWPV